MNEQIQKLNNELSEHSIYKKLNSKENLQIFMSYHVFAVWDFMSLLKGLQNKITCTSVPWVDSKYDAKLVRLVNEIVVAEESDLDLNENPASHFRMYLDAMNEVGSGQSIISNFLSDMNLKSLPEELANIVQYHLEIAQNGTDVEIASSFFFGRENIIPNLFTAITEQLKLNKLDYPKLFYYLNRHIELDGDEHGPMALECMKQLLDSPEKKQLSEQTAIESLQKRKELWDFIESKLL